jgi:hypothetical protein
MIRMQHTKKQAVKCKRLPRELWYGNFYLSAGHKRTIISHEMYLSTANAVSPWILNIRGCTTYTLFRDDLHVTRLGVCQDAGGPVWLYYNHVSMVFFF